MYCSFCGLSLLCSIAYFHALLGSELSQFFLLSSKKSITVSFCGLFSPYSLLISMHCGLLVGEFSELFTFQIKPPCFVHFVVCLCHFLLL